MGTATARASIPPLKSPEPERDRTVVIDNLVKLIEKEYQRGNQSVSKEKIALLKKYQEEQAKRDELKKAAQASKNKQLKKTTEEQKEAEAKPALPAPLYPSLYNKFTVEPDTQNPPKQIPKSQPLTFKRIENIVIAILELMANVLDNLHLLSQFPMFPKKLTRLLRNTNKLWVLILVFLIRKTISQLLNVIRKERKVNGELKILRTNHNSVLLKEDPAPPGAQPGGQPGILRKYEKVLKDLKFDKVMLIIELVGNFLDLGFNLIELYQWPVPSWFMGGLNVASMAMTIYRMNKDDEYVDDDITEDLI